MMLMGLGIGRGKDRYCCKLGMEEEKAEREGEKNRVTGRLRWFCFAGCDVIRLGGGQVRRSVAGLKAKGLWL